MPAKTQSNGAVAAPQVYRMPAVEIGQTVLWRYGPGHSELPVPAVVQKVGTSTITCALHIAGMKDHKDKTGVRHSSDPWLASAPEHDSGVWELTPRDQRINALLESFGAPAED